MQKRNVFIFLVVFFSFGLTFGCARSWRPVVAPKNRDIWVENNTIGATIRLTMQKLGGASYCTAFVVGRQGQTYQIITASHCVSAAVDGKIIIESGKLEFRLPGKPPSLSGKSVKATRVYTAEIVGIGYLGVDVGDDFALLQVELEDGQELAVVELAKKDPADGQCLFIVAFPTKANSTLFYGFVDKVDVKSGRFYFRADGIDEPGGASGAALVDCQTGEALAIWVEHRNGVAGYYIGLVVSRIKKFREAIENDTYKYYKKDKKFKKSKPDLADWEIEINY